MHFFLNFALISYAAVMFFTLGLGLALSSPKSLNLLKFILIFLLMAFFLSLAFLKEPLRQRLMISFIWTAVLGTGFRFGRKIQPRKNSSLR